MAELAIKYPQATNAHEHECICTMDDCIAKYSTTPKVNLPNSTLQISTHLLIQSNWTDYYDCRG